MFSAAVIGAIVPLHPVLAEPNLPARSECVGILTVQKRECEVESIYRCERGAEVVFRNESFDGQNPQPYVVFSKLNGPAYHATAEDGSIAFRLVEDENPFTISEMLKAGAAEVRQRVAVGLPVYLDPIEMSLRGSLSVIQDGAVVDGRPLVLLKDIGVLQTGLGLGEIPGWSDVYYDRETGASFGGRGEITMMGKTKAHGNDPVDIILPGEPGFLSEQPLYDCETLSRLDLPNSIGREGAAL